MTEHKEALIVAFREPVRHVASGRYAPVLKDFVESNAASCAMHQDYRRMIDRVKLNAVRIATPDRHHVLAAVKRLLFPHVPRRANPPAKTRGFHGAANHGSVVSQAGGLLLESSAGCRLLPK